jgi:hypothetical protein
VRRAVVAVLAAAVLLLAGCSEIPTSGTVQPGTTEAPNGTTIVYKPNPPAQGASQADIVAGFLTAASGGGSFTVAKQYLTRGLARTWDPTARVLVQSLGVAITDGSAQDFTVRVPVSAEIDRTGQYATRSGSVPLPFHLVQVAGQWRIDQAEDGIVLSQTVFQTNYVPLALQFFDPTWRHLVPDRRWFPSIKTSNGAGPSPEAVVSALIAGPAGPLGSGVVDNALKGAELSSVDATSSDVTTVALSVKGTPPSSTTTARMQEQLAQSLGLPTPSALRLVVNSVVAPQVQPLGDQLTPVAYVLLDGRFGTVSASGAFTEDKTFGPRIAATRPKAITVSLQQRLAAVLNGDGDVAIVGPSGAARTVDPRPGLVDPTLDQRGWVYSVPGDSPAGLIASNGKRTVDLETNLAPDLAGATVSAIQVSPDGTRMLVLVANAAGRPHAYVAGIERAPDGAPVGLTGSQYQVDLTGSAGTGSAATWIDDSSVAVVVTGQDNDRVVSQQLGGISDALGQFANVTSIVGTTGLDDLRIRVSQGNLYVWNDPNWQQETTSAPVQVLAVQR